MFRAGRRRKGHGYIVSQGRVACPVAPGGDVDVESCFLCGKLVAWHDEDGEGWIECRGSQPRRFWDDIGLLEPHVPRAERIGR